MPGQAWHACIEWCVPVWHGSYGMRHATYGIRQRAACVQRGGVARRGAARRDGVGVLIALVMIAIFLELGPWPWPSRIEKDEGISRHDTSLYRETRRFGPQEAAFMSQRGPQHAAVPCVPCWRGAAACDCALRRGRVRLH